jgi:hypothetical protein
MTSKRCATSGLPDGKFTIQNPNLGKFWRALELKMLVYFILVFLCPFGICYWYFVYFLVICCNFVYFHPFWYIMSRKIWQPCSGARHHIERGHVTRARGPDHGQTFCCPSSLSKTSTWSKVGCNVSYIADFRTTACQNLGSMLWSQFYEMFANFLGRNWRFSQKNNVISNHFFTN